jgi:TolB-like protein/Tfp pilus assembly protein PilF/predicted Ser/Thr protein kinase
MGVIPGTRLGPYEVLSLLGAGGMGEVYRARDTRLGREVAVKVLPTELAADRERLKRFEKEARSASSLNHPSIVTIYEIGQADAVSCIAMELVEGKTLRDLVASGSLPIKRLLQIGTQVAEGLARAHEAGIVHRDLKPENLMVTKDGLVKILDFGLAKLTHAGPGSGAETNVPTQTATTPGVVMGTVGYMSPEQAGGHPVDYRSDQFSFGSILYEIAAGKRAFSGQGAGETLAAILRDDPQPLTELNPSVPAPLGWIVERCLAKDPEARYASTKDLARELATLRDHVAETSGSGVRVSRPTGKKTKALIAAAAVILAAGALLLRRPHRSAGTAAEVKRIVVLPFENVGSSEDEYFADGMSDAVRGKLTSLPGIEVIARNSSVSYRKTAKTPSQIAEELDAPYLLMATVRWEKSGGTSRVQVSPELVQVKGSGAPTSKWQQPFDAALTDVFQVQSDIATRVAQALDVALGAAEEKHLSDRPTQNLDAYDAFLKGQEASRRFYFKEARAAYERALSLDPDFALAMLGLARVSNRDEARSLVERARRLRSRLNDREALFVDLSVASNKGNRDEIGRIARAIHEKYPDDNDAATILSNYEMSRGHVEQAVQILSELLAVDPKNAGVYNQIAYYRAYSGDYDRALENLKRYQLMEPDQANPYDSLGEVQAYSGHYDEAIANLNKALSLKPDFYESYFHLGVAYEGRGDYVRAIQDYEKAAREALTDGRRMAILGSALRAALLSGDRAAAREAAAHVAELPKGEYSEIQGSLTSACLDLVEGRNVEAERRLAELRPKLLANYEREFKDSGRKFHSAPWNYLMALAKMRQGKNDDAIALYEANANPPNPWGNFEERRSVYEARAYLSALIARKGDLDRAEKLLAENRKWNPSWAPTRPAELVVERLRRENLAAHTPSVTLPSH